MINAAPNIRSYRNEDAAAILTIYRNYILGGPYTFETDVPHITIFTQRLRDIAAKFPFFVLEEDQKIIGYAYACAHRERAAYRWAVETSIYLTENNTGRGYGKLLYSTLLENLKERNFTHAFALIGLPNEKSIKLHESCGFQELSIHREAGWKNGQWIDVCWMRLNLAPAHETPAEPLFHPAG